ncbi:ATP-binding cassette domain-containing protein [Streptococcus pneumoniae]|nr:ATP-binding cassette domain-containing protein [Streptococcus pneumoniae]
MGFLLMGALFIVLPRTMVSAKRINQVLDLHSSIQNPVQVQLTDENFKGQVEFKDVTFRYAANSEAVIEHVSFKAETCQTVAFIGSTGSGKSTLVNLIPRFYDVSAGEILVDGVNVQDYDFSATAHAGQKVAIVGSTGTGKTTIVNRLMTVAMPLVYLILLVTTYLQLGLGQQVGVYVLIPASGFVALSLFRKKINHPRPYETWDICPLLDKDSSGRSMPSRHVFSATIISMACLHASLPIGLVCLIFSALLGLVRVLGGVHYPKDVLVGYACGLVWGFLFFLF